MGSDALHQQSMVPGRHFSIRRGRDSARWLPIYELSLYFAVAIPALWVVSTI